MESSGKKYVEVARDCILENMKDSNIIFPTIKKTGVHYFDYSATTFMPQSVMDKWMELNSECGVFIGRGCSKLTKKATKVLDESEQCFRSFYDLSEEYTYIYSKNVTESINIMALSLSNLIKPLDMIVIGPYEHHSNYLPWRALAQKTGALFCEIPIKENGYPDYSYINQYEKRIKVLSVSAVSNSFGYKMDIDKICSMLSENTLFFVDESQVTAHSKICNNERITGHFLSSHKMYGPKNIAMTAIKKRIIQELSPVLLGGGMVDVLGYNMTYPENRTKFMAGTMDVALIGAWAEACRFIDRIGYTDIQRKEKLYSEILSCKLTDMGYIKIEVKGECVDSIISVVHSEIHAHDISDMLALRNIVVRSGHLCSQNAIRRIGQKAITRISLGLGVVDEDINVLLSAMEELVNEK